ncbi:MAG TPA: class I SAM-dependent methyltransferase [Microbacterium sp.]|uniref:class I SAM-dependent DNA methyltransferase n=1 Tax=Microbacterium sp. TaxID=51671 RepID=UPI002B477E2B|nr:class I SAM-dependent methyltransferase [Microbacterium sp.]HKT56786.1 class I SAM-dependent methyltransferase [Microbacterium sp.]
MPAPHHDGLLPAVDTPLAGGAAQTRLAYDTVAPDYAAQLPDASFEAPLDLAMIGEFVRRLPATAHVLDAGCGTGRMLRHLAAIAPSLRLEGVDLSPGMVAQALAASPGAPIIVGDLASLPHGNAAVDGVLAWYSLIHTAVLAPVLTELHRVLRPGGLLLTGFQSGSGQRRVERAYGHDVEARLFLRRPQEVADVARAAGFEVLVSLERAPRDVERDPQGMLLLRRG